ncbi:polyribonucleotide nucleotidyltransferase [Zobellia galactanivorans]|uniref:Polyribonucleotide nucleotidyltransferase n=1 Tax=Zobellia galactanivorans (strain DSM 12802 / CCUG 47099 / CIP 106680 / NCIMB 13871 / Dsij) TaxID=63186 RepID=G0L9U4_ZOBGA|nr:MULTISPECIES: polyribonucleotide nucleotidyltransferase [Zobellia]MBU3027403.1 polyribonucleotide nucleotidyltransferase [Zobellia galactanivorans]MDO6519195.1 polyribonucleotide nucleotidyltransferase [Zobellia uliginosa]MDO6809498.1 polyribonucleotide nucleotidyltransferase [Zobellia galactanivorans]OWW24382.1 polyribonucleotide nucleotidyltransferase [Zobellia sp. OII3]CAZ94834.1 Polyribonucleotide nucleotidyltransferase [Zobellia galactanivorans]
MIPKVFKEVIDLGDGREISIETGKLAKQAHGSVVVQSGKCMLLCTVVSNYKQSDVDFLPLTVDYREKFAAAGRYPGGFFKREARPSDGEVLTMRLVDRVLRPLFPKDYHSETQVMIQLMSHDENVMPDAMAGLAASAAIQLSDFPFECAISEARVGRVNGEFIINPTRAQLEESDIDMMIGASADSVMMVEGEMDEISEEEMTEAIKFAHEAIKEQCAAQLRLAEAFGRKEVREYEPEREDEELAKKVHDLAYDKVYAVAKAGSAKHERTAAFDAIKEEVIATFSEEEQEEYGSLISKYFYKAEKAAVRDLTLNEGLRLDGRKTDEIRPIWCEVDYLPSTHGSAIFTRGETQALATVTLGTSRDSNQIDMPSHEGEERFYLHYNFPPFSTGEARPIRGTSRREVGHGNLAQRALKGMVPDDCPYTVRVVSEVLESNGSSSMATVCSGTMALMDAGVQLKKPVSGIAMGLITDTESGKYAVLSDILGDEDHLGDMDFKVTGTADGITACQMDIKVKGLSYEILVNALKQAKDGRLHILKKLTDTIAAPNPDVKPHSPKMVTRVIPNEFIGALIGPGGKVIQELQKETGTTIVINEDPVTEEGIVEILGTDQNGIDAVLTKIDSLMFKPEVGSVYEVKVIKMLDFGAVVEYLDAPGNEVLLHVSELAWERTENVSDVVNMGDVFDVKYMGTDPRTRKEKVSRKALLPKPEGFVERPPRNDKDRGRGRDDRRGGGRDRKPRRD